MNVNTALSNMNSSHNISEKQKSLQRKLHKFHEQGKACRPPCRSWETHFGQAASQQNLTMARFTAIVFVSRQ